MGDRTTCTLSLKQKPSEEFLTLLKDRLGEADEEEGLNLTFCDINYGYLPESIEQYLIDRHLPFAWRNEAGGGYGPGVRIYDGESPLREYPLVELELALPLSRMGELEQLKKDNLLWEEMLR